MKTSSVLIAILFWPVILVRWLRWLAIAQQKEYRIDRILSFLQSPEGRRDLFKILPQKSDFTKLGLKRPVRTARVGVIALTSMMLIFLTLWAYLFLNTILFCVVLFLVYAALPFYVLVSCAPTSLISMAVTRWYLWQAQQKLKKCSPKIIGVGGSYGKTSTKHLLQHVLGQQFAVFMTPKSHNTKLSIAKSICQTYHGQEVVILEYGAYTRGEIADLTQWFQPQLAIETGFTLQHYSLFGSEENSMMAESELISALPPHGKVFCNGSDDGAVRICEFGAKDHDVEIVYYSGIKSVVQLTQPAHDQMGKLHFGWKEKLIHTQLVGLHYVVNVQAAIAVAQEMGMTDDEIIRGIESFEPNASFVRSSLLASGALLIDDGGTSNPKGFLAAIELAKEIHRSPRILITSGIVDLGEKSSTVHLDLAKAAAAVFEQVLYVGIDGLAEFEKEFDQKIISEQYEIELALKRLDANTVVVVEGRIPKWVENALK